MERLRLLRPVDNGTRNDKPSPLPPYRVWGRLSPLLNVPSETSGKGEDKGEGGIRDDELRIDGVSNDFS